MKHEIKVYCKKFLVLRDTAIITIETDCEIGTLIYSSISKMKANGLSVCGPPILWTSMRTENNLFLFERKLFLQYRGDASKIPKEYEKKNDIKIGPCVYARFEGIEEDLRYAFEKISVVAYENEITLKKENYTIYVEKNDISCKIDIFIPQEG